MSVLVDTSVWSLALRRRSSVLNSAERETVRAWVELVEAGDIVLIGPIRQELLSGLRDRKVFEDLAERLSGFDDLPIETQDYVQAAEYFNLCRKRGITGTPTDLLICAVAMHYDVPIFTRDADFNRYVRLLPIRLYL